jgi:hypothetical protein
LSFLPEPGINREGSSIPNHLPWKRATNHHIATGAFLCWDQTVNTWSMHWECWCGGPCGEHRCIGSGRAGKIGFISDQFALPIPCLMTFIIWVTNPESIALLVYQLVPAERLKDKASHLHKW